MMMKSKPLESNAEYRGFRFAYRHRGFDRPGSQLRPIYRPAIVTGTCLIHCHQLDLHIHLSRYCPQLSQAMATVMSVPAGRCSRRAPDSKWVDPSADKGLLEMKLEEDLMRLCEWTQGYELCKLAADGCLTDGRSGWKSRDSGAVEDVWSTT